MTVWQRIKALFKRPQPEIKLEPVKGPVTEVPIHDPTPWMTVAHREIGQREIAGDQDNPRIIEYHSYTTLKATDDETPWCSAFVCFCLETTGYRSTKNAWARSFMTLETKLLQGRYGAIVVFTRGDTSGHVGFYLDENDTHVYVLGGNQGNSVSKAWYAKNRLLGYRWPSKRTEIKHT